MNVREEAMAIDFNVHMTQMKCNFFLLEDERMHPGQIALIMRMQELGPSSQKVLARALSCSPASIGVSVKRLEKAGLLEKQTDPRDMRATKVGLTPQGTETAGRCGELMELLTQRKYAGFSEEEIRTLLSYQTRIRENLLAFQRELSRDRDRSGTDAFSDPPENRRNRGGTPDRRRPDGHRRER